MLKMQQTKHKKCVRSAEGNYMFACPPRTLFKPISIRLSTINNGKASTELKQRTRSVRSSKRCRNLRAAWSGSKEFYDQSASPFDTPVEEKISSDEILPLTSYEKLNLGHCVECQTDTILSNQTPLETVDVGIQINKLVEKDYASIEYLAEEKVSCIIEEALIDVLSIPNLPDELDVLCPNCSDALKDDNFLKMLQRERDYMYITTKVFAESFMDQLVPSLIQKMEDNHLLQDSSNALEFGCFLPWFMDEFDKEASKLEKLCKTMEDSLNKKQDFGF